MDAGFPPHVNAILVSNRNLSVLASRCGDHNQGIISNACLSIVLSDFFPTPCIMGHDAIGKLSLSPHIGLAGSRVVPLCDLSVANLHT